MFYCSFSCEVASGGMLTLEQGFQVLFRVGCFILAGYMAYQQFEQFTLNHDSSILGYRQFNEGREDLYPAYTVCIKSMDRGSIFRNDENFLNLTEYPSRFVYNQILQGKCCNDKNLIAKALGMDYEDVLGVDIRNYVTTKVTINKVGDEIDSWTKAPPQNNSVEEMNTFYRSYQDPNMVCMTNKVQYSPNLHLKRDFVLFDAETMYVQLLNISRWYYSMDIEFFIHQPGNLITILNDPILRLSALQFEFLRNTSRFVTARINQVDVLEKREDAENACNKSLTNFDQMYKESVIKSIGCIPHYWKWYMKGTDITEMANCTTKDQFLRLSQYLPLYYENGIKLFTPPCRQMTVTFDMASSDISYGAGQLGFTIYYGSENYK